MAEKNPKSVPIKGPTDKRNITLTFVISLAGEFLPMQVIYLETLYFQRDFVLRKTQNTTQTKRKLLN